MTDARFPERWLNDRRILRLPADVFRVFVLALAWSVANHTDGMLRHDDLDLVPGFDSAAAARLATSGLWAVEPDGWLIADFEGTQTSAAQLEATAVARRASDRERQARRRELLSRELSRDNPRDNTRPGQARTGTKEQPPTKVGGDKTRDVPGDSERDTCAEPDCPLPPRRACRTCWAHAYREAVG